MFKKIDVYMNRNLIRSTGDLFAYKAYFNKLFRSSAGSSADTSAEYEMFLKQDGGFPEATDPGSGN
jgi:hypothetical protein